jgi:outer membrane protein TolC
MLKAARAGVDQARAVKLQTWSGYLPSVRISEGMMRSNDAVHAFGVKLKQERFSQADFAVSALNYPQAIANFQTKLEVKQPLFNGGQAFYGRRQAQAGVKIAQSELDRSVLQVRFQTAQAYWGVVFSQEALQAVQQGLETALAFERVADARFREETVGLTDLLAAKVRVAELKGEKMAAQNRVDEAIDGLALVLGMEMGTSFSLSDELVRKPVPEQSEPFIARAMVLRPDLTGVRAQMEAASQNVGVARAAMLPHVNAFAEVALDSDELFARKGESWTTGIVLSWDLFDGGKMVGVYKEARAKREAARVMAQFKTTDVVREVRAAFRQAKAANAQVDSAEEALNFAQERLRIVQLQYQEGVATATDMLGAESELRHARVRKAAALHGLNISLSELEFVVGELVQ